MSKRKPGKQGASGAARASSSRSSGPMDVGLLEQIVRLMSANDLNTVDLRDGDKRVVLKRGANVVQYAAGPVMTAAPQIATPAPASQPPAGAAGPSATDSADADAKLIRIKSPMVGTFYAAPKQGEKPYISVGSEVVAEETDICIIEAMKVFNVLKADTSGTVAKVMVQDGQPVEHGTVLFLVKPA